MKWTKIKRLNRLAVHRAPLVPFAKAEIVCVLKKSPLKQMLDIFTLLGGLLCVSHAMGDTGTMVILGTKT